LGCSRIPRLSAKRSGSGAGRCLFFYLIFLYFYIYFYFYLNPYLYGCLYGCLYRIPARACRCWMLFFKYLILIHFIIACG